MSTEPDPATCPATKTSNTATGPEEVRCGKDPGHVAAGDDRHAGKTNGGRGMPVYWEDPPTP